LNSSTQTKPQDADVEKASQSKIGHIHIPKCGGSFLKHWFRDNDIPLPKVGHHTLEERRHQADWWWATVRNPYHRMVSFYEFLPVKARRELELGRKPQRFEQYRKMIDVHAKGFRYFLEHGDQAIWYLHRPQWEWLVDGQGQVDCIIKLEEVYEQWHQIQTKTGCTHPLPRHTPKTQQLEQYYDNYTTGLVQELYAKDFDNLGYDK